MTSYITITDAETDPEAPLTSELAKKWRDNPLAIAEADSTAPANLLPTVLLGTLNTTSGTTVTLSSLVLTPYKTLLFIFNGVVASTPIGATSNFSLASMLIETIPSATTRTYRGTAVVELSSGVGSLILNNNHTAAAPSTAVSSQTLSLRSNISASTTSISISNIGTGASFSGGSLLIYGVK